MNLPDQHLLLGLTLGALAATGLAALGSSYAFPAFGDEPGASVFNAARLLHFKDSTVEVDDSVSTVPLNTIRVKKVEHGMVSYIDIVTTSTGTYSTDGLGSPNVQYPGIEKHSADTGPGIWGWGPRGWGTLHPVHASSITYVRAGSNRIITGPGFACIIGRYSTTC